MSRTILIVDDDPEFLSALSALLRAEGYSIIAAKDGREAIVAIGNYQYFIAAAIIDLALPEIGGFQVIAELTRVQKKAIPLMAITGAYGDVYLEVAQYLGARVSLRKPLRGEPLTPLVTALNTLVDSTSARHGSA